MLEKRELNVDELEAERAAELPERAVLSFVNINLNITPVVALNGALALNAATIGSSASAWAGQIVGVGQIIH